MAHEAYRLLSKITNTPHLIQANEFEVICSYLKSRAADDFKPVTPTEAEDRESYQASNELGIGVINIEGPLTYKPVTIMGMDCGGSNYQTIKQDFTTLVDQGVSTIVLSIDSPGGESFQAFDTARYMRQLADDNDVRIVTYVDGTMASAAYVLGCIADEVVATGDSEIGSIGVLVKLMNDSKALEEAGYERTFITAGAQKVPFDADGAFTQAFLDNIQGKVDDTYLEFRNHVSQMRGISDEAVVATEAKTFVTSKAIDLSLADKEMTHEEFKKYLIDTTERKQGASMLGKFLTKEDKKEDKQMSVEKLQEAEAQLAALGVEKEQLAVQVESLGAQLATSLGDAAESKKALEEALAKVAVLEKAQVETKLSARKEKLAAVLPEDQVDTVAASLEALGDDAFATVLSGFGSKQVAKAKDDLFQELGSAQAPAAQQKAETKVSSTSAAIARITRKQ